ncbi:MULTISPECIES: ATP-binding protein [unclassified Streptomyces]|uniref:ATP-binding protein n=1 Tax=unclassified Streptomyces TaxID=2593676 RepID=UPI00382DE152
MTTPVPENAAAARDAVMQLLTSQFCGLVGEGLAADVVVADALLVTSELVTNAVRHGGGLTGFSAELTDEGLRLAVADASRELPVTGDTDADSSGVGRIGGYGWVLVRRLTKQVSVSVHPGGKSIVALISLT